MTRLLTTLQSRGSPSMEPQRACALSSRALSAFVSFQTCGTSPLRADLPTHKSRHHISPPPFFFWCQTKQLLFFSLPLISQGFQASPLAFTKSVTFVFLLNCKAGSGAHPPYSGLLFAAPSPAAPPLNRLTILPADQPSWSSPTGHAVYSPSTRSSLTSPTCFNPGPPYPHLDHWNGLQWLSYLYPLTVAIHLSSCSPFLTLKPVHITHLQRHNPSGFRIRL